MYEIVDYIPDNWDNDRRTCIIALEDEYGGQSVIAKDDGCYTLWNGSNYREFRMVHHWYPEAHEALYEHTKKKKKRISLIQMALKLLRRT